MSLFHEQAEKHDNWGPTRNMGLDPKQQTDKGTKEVNLDIVEETDEGMRCRWED